MRDRSWQKWIYLHICPLDKECRKHDAPWRVSICVWKYYFSFALRSRDKFVGKVGDPNDYWTMRGRKRG